jgi:hypothetical protein
VNPLTVAPASGAGTSVTPVMAAATDAAMHDH